MNRGFPTVDMVSTLRMLGCILEFETTHCWRCGAWHLARSRVLAAHQCFEYLPQRLASRQPVSQPVVEPTKRTSACASSN